MWLDVAARFGGERRANLPGCPGGGASAAAAAPARMMGEPMMGVSLRGVH